MGGGIETNGEWGSPAPPARVDFQISGRAYLLSNYVPLSGRWAWPLVGGEECRRLLRQALASDATLATQIRGRFVVFDGGRATIPRAAPAELADRIGSLVAARRLMLADAGPLVVPVAAIAEGPSPQALAALGFAAKAELVVSGLADVNAEAWGDKGKAALQQLKDAMTSSPALITTMVFVIAAWIAAHATGVIGLALDAALFGIVVYSLGMGAFAWFEKLATLIGDIDAARTDAHIRRCSEALAGLIVEIGVTVFITLLLRAAGRNARRSSPGDQPDIPRAPPRSEGPPASAPVGRRAPTSDNANRQLTQPPGAPRNAPGAINGRPISGHALDQMQNRGLTPSVVDNAIRTGTRTVTDRSIVFHDAINNVTVITNRTTGNVITVY